MFGTLEDNYVSKDFSFRQKVVKTVEKLFILPSD